MAAKQKKAMATKCFGNLPRLDISPVNYMAAILSFNTASYKKYKI